MKKLASLLALLAVLVCGCAQIDLPLPPAVQTPEFKIAVLSDRTDKRQSPGEREPDGLAFYYGVQMAVNEAVTEYRGKLKVTLLEKDIAGDLASAKPLCKELIKEGADAIVCPATIAAKIASTAKANNIALMVPDYDDRVVSLPKKDDEDQTPDSLVRKNDFIWSILPSGEEYGRLAAFYARLQSWDSAILLYDDTNLFWSAAADSFKETFESYGRKILNSKANPCTNASLLRDIAESFCTGSKAECLFIGCDPDKAVNAVLPGVRNAFFKGSSFYYSGATDYTVAFEADGFSSWYLNDQNCLAVFSGTEKKGACADFYAEYERLYGERAGFSAAIAHDGAAVLLKAAATAGSGSLSALRSAMSDLRYSGATGLLRYAADGVGYPLRSLYGMTFQSNAEDYTKVDTRVKFAALAVPEDELEAADAPSEVTSEEVGA